MIKSIKTYGMNNMLYIKYKLQNYKINKYGLGLLKRA